MIYSLTTYNVTVSVESKYHDINSEQSEDHIFVYRVNITNDGDEPVQLMRRHWFIFDSIGSHNEIEGDGVVGEQPLLLPGESHEYVSWSPLTSDLGKMSGNYTFMNVRDGSEFVVDIPEFLLMPKYLMN
jgi:ApaG protein